MLLTVALVILACVVIVAVIVWALQSVDNDDDFPDGPHSD